MPELLTTDEVAERLRASPKTLERWRVHGDGPRFIKAGRKILYRWADVETWIDGQSRQSTSEAA